MKLRRFIAALTACVMAAAALYLPAGAEAKKTNSLVILGDSIATGFGLKGYNGTADSSEYSFGSRLSAGFTSKVNLAADSRDSAGLLKTLGEKDVKKAIKKADSIVISIGGNDLLLPMLKKLRETADSKLGLLRLISNKEAVKKLTDEIIDIAESIDLKKSRSNISSIFKKIRKLNPGCDIYILTVYDPFEGIELLSALEKTAEARINKLDKYIVSAAGKYGVRTVDIYSAFRGRAEKYTNIMRFDIHPNKAGHSAIAEEIIKAGLKMNDSGKDSNNKKAA